MIVEVEELLDTAEAHAHDESTEFSQTAQKKLEKGLKELASVEWDEEQGNAVLTLAERTLALPITKGRKIRDKNAKKLLNLLTVH